MQTGCLDELMLDLPKRLANFACPTADRCNIGDSLFEPIISRKKQSDFIVTVVFNSALFSS